MGIFKAPKTIKLRCGVCSRSLRLPFMTVTEQFTRTCRGCKTRQRILVKPEPLHHEEELAGYIHLATIAILD